jgi:hypothetical protein
MIRAYPERATVLPGQTLTLHVSDEDKPDDATVFRVRFFRQGDGLTLIDTSGWLPLTSAAEGSADVDWGWPAYGFAIPGNWSSGAYVAMLEEGDANHAVLSSPDASTAWGVDSKALFVVASATPGSDASILYKLSIATYQAYNFTGWGSLYQGSAWVTTLRPGGGTGGLTSFTPDIEPNNPGDVDVYDLSSPRSGFAHWDAPFIGWLERNGYAVDYCTDWDVDAAGADTDLLSKYCLLLSVGHDEYWSDSMRENVESFIAAGGNVAFFSGNTCWWHIALDQSRTKFSRTGYWHDPPASRPENSLTGVSYRGAGGHWDGARSDVPYTVQYHDHWVFDGTGLNDGDLVGAGQHLVGYEADGAAFTTVQGIAQPTGADGTPLDFTILGLGALGGDWQDRETGQATATMGVRTAAAGGGVVFTAATVDWARVLGGGADARVERITKNVLDRLLCRSLRVVGPLPLVCGSPLAVEGGTSSFHVDTSALADPNTLDFAWSASTGAGPFPDLPAITMTMPSPPVAVTISVTASRGAQAVGFGTLTCTPLTRAAYLQVQLWCQLKQMVMTAARARRALIGVENEGGSLFVDPLWDEVPDAFLAPFSVATAERLSAFAGRMSEIAHALVAHLSEPGPARMAPTVTQPGLGPEASTAPPASRAAPPIAGQRVDPSDPQGQA